MSVDFDLVRSPPRAEQVGKLRSWVGGDLTIILAIVTLLAEAIAVSRVAIRSVRPPLAEDAAVSQHMGWYLVNGGTRYIDMWEAKPPLSYETTAVMAAIFGDSLTTFHAANVVLMSFTAVGIVVLVGRLVEEITRDPMAGVVGGLSMLLLPGFLIRPAYGFEAKYLLLLCGLLAIWLFLRDRPFLAGAAAAASTGYWLPGVVFPIVLLGLALHRRDRRAFGWVVAGSALFTTLMLVPVALDGALGQLLVQAVIAPLVLPDVVSLPRRLYAGMVHFRFALPLVLLGALGLIQFARSRTRRDHWWVLACAAWFGFVLLVVEFEPGGFTNLVPVLAFVAVGLGYLYANTGRSARRLLLGGVVAAVVINVVALGGFGTVFDPVSTPTAVTMDELRVTSDLAVQQRSVIPNAVPDVRNVFWNHLHPDSW